MDIQKLFETDLANAMAAKPDAVQRVGAKFQFNISGEGGGEWFVDASSSGPKVAAGNPGGADCTFGVSVPDFEQLWQNPSTGMNLFFSGRLRISGDTMVAMRFQDLVRAL
jgi:putative sterol carrier protein